MASSKFSHRPPESKPPAYCKRVAPTCVPTGFPPPHFVASIWWQGYTSVPQPLNLLRSIDLIEHSPGSATYHTHFVYDGFDVAFEFFSADLLVNYSALLNLSQLGAPVASAFVTNRPTLPNPTYDTREQNCVIVVGSGNAGFRVML